MTIITAKTAREIAENVLENAIGSTVETAMELIIIAANQGKTQITFVTPMNWDDEQRERFWDCLHAFGYKIIPCDYCNSRIDIVW